MPWIALFFVVAVLSGPLSLPFVLPPKPDAPVVVVSLRGASAAQDVVRAAGGRVVAPLQASFGVIAAGDGPGFTERLYRAGAVAVVDAEGMGALCGNSS